MNSSARPKSSGFLTALVVLLFPLIYLFHDSFKSDLTLFSNDGPLAVQMADWMKMPDGFVGMWVDTQWLGWGVGPAAFNPAMMIHSMLHALYYSKFVVPICLLFLGLSAWSFGRLMGFSQGVSILTALAAMLNMNTVSHTGWGLASRATAQGAIFLALAAIQWSSQGRRWHKLILAGFAIGLSIMDGSDNGAIYSVYVGLWVLFLAFGEAGPVSQRAAQGMGRGTVVAICAGILAAQMLMLNAKFLKPTLRTTDQMAGQPAVPTAEEKKQAELAAEAEKEKSWVFATQWSLPKIEIVRMLIPGIFGYRMYAGDGSDYWGGVGQEPYWEQTPPEKRRPGSSRYSGAGEYAGIFVVLVASWALVQSLGRKTNIYSDAERRMIWFWSGASFVSMLFAFGRHAAFFQFVHALPYFSSVRNAIKFMHPLHLGLLILFAFGLQGMVRRYLDVAPGRILGLLDQIKAWWSKTTGPEKKWAIGAMVFLLASLGAFMIYKSSDRELHAYLQAHEITDPVLAGKIIKFSQFEFGLYVAFLASSIGLLFSIFSGFFAGERARWALILVGLILVADLLHADHRWIIYENFKEKYVSNAFIDRLAEKPHEARVTELGQLRKTGQFSMELGQALSVACGNNERWFQQYEYLWNFYDVGWLQALFPYYHIQSLDMPQNARGLPNQAAYDGAFRGSQIGRMWELTNTRYLVGAADAFFVNLLNQQFDPVQRRFKIVSTFTLESGVIPRAVPAPGPFALIEFGGALPRAKLYTNWQLSHDDQATLSTLASPGFDPASSVIVSGDGPQPPTLGASAPAAGSVEITSYTSKRIQLKAKTTSASVLLFNDRHDPDWYVFVDGKPETLLRCNFIMRGVALPPGEHGVEFRYRPNQTWLYVTMAAHLTGFIILGFLLVTGRRTAPTGSPVPAAVAPASVPPTPEPKEKRKSRS